VTRNQAAQERMAAQVVVVEREGGPKWLLPSCWRRWCRKGESGGGCRWAESLQGHVQQKRKKRRIRSGQKRRMDRLAVRHRQGTTVGGVARERQRPQCEARRSE
jgi:hypothetical protein